MHRLAIRIRERVCEMIRETRGKRARQRTKEVMAEGLFWVLCPRIGKGAGKGV